MHDPGTNGLQGRVAVVTGGASGIGRSAAVALASQGANVAVLDLDSRSATETAAEIVDFGGCCIALDVDVRDEASVDDAMTTVADRLGRIDALVTSAGVQRYGTVTETPTDLWDEVFAVNVRGVFFAARAAMPHLRSSNCGAIVIVSSVQARATQSGVVAYTASKGALNALARALAVDEARFGVRVNTVSPGSVDTPMLRHSARMFGGGTDTGTQQNLHTWGGSHPLGRIADATEVADAIAFLLGDRASFVTGVDLGVDGGLSAQLGVVLRDDEN